MVYRNVGSFSTKEPTEQPRTYSSLHQNIQDSFNAIGIEIVAPYYSVLKDRKATTVQSDIIDNNKLSCLKFKLCKVN